MKQLQNNFTTPEQSKRLLELGMPADSADMMWDGTFNNENEWEFEPFPTFEDKPFSFWQSLYRHIDSCNILPCWSVGRLIEIMTICYKWDLLSCASFRIYVTDIIGHNLINQLINDLSLEISRGKMDFSKLEEG